MPSSVFHSVFPWNQEPIAEYPQSSEQECNSALIQTAVVFDRWRKTTFELRSGLLRKVAAQLRKQKETLAALITREMGKVIGESHDEIEKCAVTCEYYATHAESFLRDEPTEAGYTRSFSAYEPIGAVLAIMPWNFPFWQVFRFAAPTLMAGNICLLKHAPNVCGCSLAIQQVFLDAGAEPGLFTSLIIDTPVVEKLLQMPIVQAVTLTGSDKAGSSVAALAGKHIRKSVMELGGSDALIVLEDADIARAAETALRSRMQNAGQSCIAAKRFIVVATVHNQFVEALIEGLDKLKQGDPFAPGTTTGPVARPDLATNIMSQLERSVKAGAMLAFGGDASGCNVEPALLTGVKKGMAAFEEETFGPLAAVIAAKDENEAIRLANYSKYGLASSIWSRDLDRAVALSRQLEAGAVFINTLVKSDARLPFGGVKQSGYGRELGREGIREFVNVKAIAVQE